ncbi:MAG TPA: hypothetical protein IGS52_03675 [Oscillatoriaceae cyanobacterium M33_DOE_052]|uniref:Uncharacterized protein n=1 Tax=Planktothricoides sp. SpSt-374 TaxID=2282167 RepID=A0A7C3VRD2_9CYAN|nr:hypothetical protein [Oscillatoriaceae cyanobacterium M33_DOE_052]
MKINVSIFRHRTGETGISARPILTSPRQQYFAPKEGQQKAPIWLPRTVREALPSASRFCRPIPAVVLSSVLEEYPPLPSQYFSKPPQENHC